MSEPIWLTVEQIVRLNEMLVAMTGERHLVVDRGLLEGAVARPKNLCLYENEADLIVLAVRLLEGIGRNHCFQQGNKRTAFHAAMAFLRANGWLVFVPDSEDVAALVEGVIVGHADPATLVAVLRAGLPRLS